MLLKFSQRMMFPEVVEAMEEKGTLPEGSPFKKFNLFLDKDGLIRLESRMSELQATFEIKHPVLIAAKNYIIEGLIRDEHYSVLKHSGGPRDILANLYVVMVSCCTTFVNVNLMTATYCGILVAFNYYLPFA